MGGSGRIAQFGDASFLLPGKFFYESNMRNARICALCALSSPDRLRNPALENGVLSMWRMKR